MLPIMQGMQSANGIQSSKWQKPTKHLHISAGKQVFIINYVHNTLFSQKNLGRAIDNFFSLTKFTKFFLGILIGVVLIGFFGGVIKTFLDLNLLFHTSIEVALRQMILNVLILLAVVE